MGYWKVRDDNGYGCRLLVLKSGKLSFSWTIVVAARMDSPFSARQCARLGEAYDHKPARSIVTVSRHKPARSVVTKCLHDPLSCRSKPLAINYLFIFYEITCEWAEIFPLEFITPKKVGLSSLSSGWVSFSPETFLDIPLFSPEKSQTISHSPEQSREAWSPIAQ